MDFYYFAGSAPCRSILMTAKALGIKMNLKVTDLTKGEHMTPEFLKMNPQHTIPTLNDHGFSLWESRAILIYLVEKYGKGSTLYPTDVKARAIVNQRLYFDMTLYQRFGDYFYPQHFAKAPADPEKLKKLEEIFGFLNTFLEGQKYAAGANMTIADLALVATVSTTVELLNDFDINDFPNVARWYKLMKATAPGYSLNVEGDSI